jgi:hypothetical protein
MCDGKCIDCYTEKDLSDPSKVLNFIQLDWKTNESRTCANEHFFDSYNFESVMLITSFQQQSLANHRKSEFPLFQHMFKNNNHFYNRNLLPEIVLNIQRENKDTKGSKFNVEVRLNDMQHVGQSSLFKDVKYRIKLYLFENDNNMGEGEIGLFHVKVTLISESDILATDSFRIKNLKTARYLIEVKMEILFKNENSLIIFTLIFISDRTNS